MRSTNVAARAALRAARALPGVYPALAFLAARRVTIRGRSMEPTLVPGEKVAFDRLAYALGAPAPGDIVLARHPARPGVLFVKRLAAIEGDGFILLGDNPACSTDSRALGPFRPGDILARAWFVYWPLERMRHLNARGPSARPPRPPTG